MSTNDEKPMLKQDADKEEKTPEEVEWESRIRLTPQFNQLIQANLEADVIFEMFKLIERGMFTFEDVDEIVRVTITRFTRKQGIQFFKVLGAKDFTHIMRKSHYIVSQMKLFKYYIDQKATIFNGPDQKKVQELLDRTGYSLKVTTGMRQYGGPPPEWDGESPLHREISISKVPDDWYEDKLVPVLEKYGKIYELRIMIDNITGLTRNFCFVKYCDEQDNLNALSKIDNLWIPFEQDNKNKLEIEGGVTLKANFSTCNKRLFVGNVPKTETKNGFIKTFSQFVEGIEDAEVYVSDEMVKVGLENRGFVFLEFKSHNQAAEGKRVLAGIGEKVYEGNMLKVEWAEPAYCPSAEETAKVKAIHVSNLSREVTEDLLRSTFERYGKLFHVQKVRDYAFIHYDERESALKALDEAKDLELCGFKIKVNISTSGPLMRKIKKQNKLAWLRGEFGFGKKKERQAPPPPRRGRGFHRGSFQGSRDDRSYSSGGDQRYGQKRSYDDRDGFHGSDRRSSGGYSGRDGGYGGRDGGYGGRDGGYGGRDDGYGGSGGRYGGGGGYHSGGSGGYSSGGGGGGYMDWESGYSGGYRDDDDGYSGGYGQGGGKIRRY